MLGMLGSFNRCKYMNVKKGYEVLIGANIWMLGMNVKNECWEMLGSFDRWKYMNGCIIKFMYVCRCKIFLVLRSWEF